MLAHRLSVPLSLIALAAAALAGCGGGGGTGSRSLTGPGTPTPPPPLVLVSSTPAQGASSVDVATAAVLVFDASVDAATLAAGITVSAAGAPAAVSTTASGTSVTILPPQGAQGRRWPFDASVVISVSSGLLSSGGVAAQAVTVTFSTTPLSSVAVASGARSGAQAVVLDDGRILTSGGVAAAGSVAAADLFDPESGAFTATASLRTPRWGASAVKLKDGRVMVAGGFDFAGNTALTSIEIYDPASATWTAIAARLAVTRVFHDAFLLPSGNVAIVGGDDTFIHAGVVPRTGIELFDPRAETATALAGVTATAGTWAQLTDGRLLCVPSSGAVDPTVWDLDAASPAPAATVNRPASTGEKRVTARLDDGRILVAGGLIFGAGPPSVITATQVYDPATSAFTSGPVLQDARFAGRAVTLLDGRVAVVGGGRMGAAGPVSVASIEVFDPRAGTMARISAPVLDFPSVVTLGDGSLLVTSSRTSHTNPATASGLATRVPAAALGGAAGPRVLGIEAAGARDASAPAGALRVRFSEAMNPATLVAASFDLRGPSGPVAVDVVAAPDGRSCFLVPVRPLEADAPHVVTAGAALRSAGGVALSSGAGERLAFRTGIANPLPSGALFAIERTRDVVLRLVDRNGDGDLRDPGESTDFWTAGSATLLQHGAVTREGVVYVGESTGDRVFRLEDRDGDGDADDTGESTVFVDNSSALGAVLSGISSVAFGHDGTIFISNAGSGAVPDVILTARDLNGDGDALDPDELSRWNDTDMVGAPWALSTDPYGALWHTETGPGPEALYRLQDLNGDGDSTDGAGASAERRTIATTGGLPTYVAFTPGFAPLLWHSTGSLPVRLERVDVAAGVTAAAVFTNPGGLVGAASGVATFASGVLYAHDVNNDTIWRLFDENANGSLDDAGECVAVFDGTSGIYDSGFFVFGGHAPEAPRLFTAPAGGATVLGGVVARRATVHGSVNGTPLAATIIADDDGLFTLSTGLPLVTGDVVTLRAETAGGLSRSIAIGVR